jgi:ligand-binding sensor domain-containing protein
VAPVFRGARGAICLVVLLAWLPGCGDGDGAGEARAETFANANEILDVAIAPDGRVWTAGPGGVTAWTDGAPDLRTVDDGLPSSLASAVAVAEDGTVWVGTLDAGVGRFAGGRWVVDRPGDGFPLALVTDLAIDGGTVYAAGQRIVDGSGRAALARFEDGSWGRTVTLKGDHATGVAVAPDGAAWVSTFDAGVARVDGPDVRAYRRPDGLSDDYIRDVAVTSDGVVSVATSNHVSTFDGATWTGSRPGRSGVCEAIAVAPDGILWCGGIGAQIHRLDPDGWTTIPVDVEGLPTSSGLPEDRGAISSLAIAPDGTAWAGTWRDGLLSYRDGGWARHVDPGCPPANHVTTISATDGAVWVATPGGVGELRDDEWTSYPPPAGGTTCLGGLTVDLHACGPVILALAAGAGEVYAAGEGGGYGGAPLMTLEGDAWAEVGVDAGDELGGPITDLALDGDGTLWAVSGLTLLERHGDEWTTHRSEGLAPLEMVAIGGDGTVWIAAANEWESYAAGVAAYVDGDWRTYPAGTDDLPMRELSAIAVGPDGTLWVGSAWDGLASFDGSNWSFVDPSEQAGLGGLVALAAAPDGAVWIASDRRGLTRYDGDSWTTFTAAEGLASNVLTDVTVAGDGTVWVGTPAGLQQLRI